MVNERREIRNVRFVQQLQVIQINSEGRRKRWKIFQGKRTSIDYSTIYHVSYRISHTERERMTITINRLFQCNKKSEEEERQAKIWAVLFYSQIYRFICISVCTKERDD